MSVLVEICCDGIEAARRAVWRGAGRIELCADLSCGGITPTFTDIFSSTNLGVPVNVLVRPRPGNFVYSWEEVEKMSREIAACGQVGMNGVVIGVLRPDGRVDLPVCRDLIALARSYGLSVTFHRAVDEALAAGVPLDGLMEDILSLGVDRILTSGGAAGAYDGRTVIARMAGIARRSGSCIVMPGGGVTPGNLAAILEATGATEVHGSRLSLLSSSC